MAWADVASEAGLQNGKCCDKKGKSCLFRKISRTHKRLGLDLLFLCIRRLRLIRRRPRKRKNNNTNTSPSSTILEYSIALAFALDVWTSLCLRLRLRLRRTCEPAFKVRPKFEAVLAKETCYWLIILQPIKPRVTKEKKGPKKIQKQTLFCFTYKIWAVPVFFSLIRLKCTVWKTLLESTSCNNPEKPSRGMERFKYSLHCTCILIYRQRRTRQR